MATATLTFGECAENHVGMQKIGMMASEGLSSEDLARAQRLFEAAGAQCELTDLVAAGAVEGPPASNLVVRGGVDVVLSNVVVQLRAAAMMLDELLGVDSRIIVADMLGCGVAAVMDGESAADGIAIEQSALPTDKMTLSRGVVKALSARHNLCFADDRQEPSYEDGRGRVIAFEDVPLMAAFRDALPKFFGAKADSLFAEGNYYFKATSCGIRFHGDAERKIVIALRIGKTIPLHYQWFRFSRPMGERIALAPAHGDMYAMSAKAVGFDWRDRRRMTLRHAAGAPKFLAIPGW